MAAEHRTLHANGWVADCVAELRADKEHQAKVRRIREAVNAGTFEGHATTQADLDSLDAETSG